jgi:hypothetical protein
VVTIKPINKFKTFKYDSAPFFFFIDVFPANYSNKNKPNLIHLINSIKTNPIMPLPMRIDRVFNGERSVLIRPKEPISFSVSEDLTAIINPDPFLQLGFEKLLYFTEVRSREKFLLSLSPERALKWWQATKFLYGNLSSLEEDFSAFLRAYLHTVVKAKILEEDLVSAAQNYCQLIADVCRKRMEQNKILVEVRGKQETVKMYKIKDFTYYKKFKKTTETQYHPELIDIEIYDLSLEKFSKAKEDRTKFMDKAESKELKYIPLLFYDDLLECMLQNLIRLENNDSELLDPSMLFQQNVILTQKSKDLENIKMQDHSWWNTFDNINLNSITRSILKIHEDFFLSLGIEKRR